MWSYNYAYPSNELYHHGIKGQRWGVRRYQNKNGSLTNEGKNRYSKRIVKFVQDSKRKENTYRKKLTAIEEAGEAGKSDLNTIKYRNRSLTNRIGTQMMTLAIGTIVKDVMTGDVHKYSEMNKTELGIKIAGIVASSSGTVAYKSLRAKSVANKYDDNGVKIKGKKNSNFTREDAIEMATKSVAVAATVAPAIAMVMKMKANSDVVQKAANEAKFKSYGSNILPEKVGNVIPLHNDEYKILN